MRRSGVQLAWGAFRVVSMSAISLIALAAVPVAGQVPRSLTSPSFDSAQDASDSDDEVLLGTIDIQARDATSETAGRSSAQQDSPAAGVGNAAAFYAQALQALEAGNFVQAERLFEKTVEAAPDGPRAADARRHLGQLYTAAPQAPQVKAEPGAIGPPAKPTADDVQSNDPGGAAADGEAAAPNQKRYTESDAQQFVTAAGDRVFFGASSAELGTRARAVIAAQAAWLIKRPQWNVTVEGHADDPPLSSQDMDELSQARAEAVRDRLAAEGVAPRRINTVPWGRQAPISDCAETACQAQNRRAVSVLTPVRPANWRQMSLQGAEPRLPVRSPLAQSAADPDAR